MLTNRREVAPEISEKIASRFTSHRTPKRKQGHCDFAVAFFQGLGMAEKNFPSPETTKFKAWQVIEAMGENFLSTYFREVSGDGGLLHSYFAIIF